MEFELYKSSLHKANSGICKSNNNARYTGNTSCWTISMDGEPVVSLRRKKDALVVLNFCKSMWDGKGDVIMAANDSGVLPNDFKGEC